MSNEVVDGTISMLESGGETYRAFFFKITVQLVTLAASTTYFDSSISEYCNVLRPVN